MANRTIEIRITAQNKASSVIDRVVGSIGGLGSTVGGAAGKVSALGNVLQTALGVTAGNLVASAMDRIGESLIGFGKQALAAVGHAQTLEMQLEGLLTESAMYQKVNDARQVAIKLTDAERQKITDLTLDHATLTARIQEQKERIRQLTEQYGENGLAVQTARARLAEMTNEQGKLTASIDALQSKEGKLATVTRESYKQVMSLADAQGIAREKSQTLLRAIEKLAIVSPFETSQVEQIAKLGLMAKLSTEQVENFTKSFLDYAAVHGIASGDLAFAADQFLQLAKVGKLTAIDMRQLRRLGIDVAQILGVDLGMSTEQLTKKFGKLDSASQALFSGMTVDEFNAKVAKTPELMQLLFEKFALYSEQTTAGAAERMARTIDGMMSTAKDIVEVGGRNLFRPIVDAVSPMLSRLLDKLADFATGDRIKQIGRDLAETITLTMQGKFSGAVGKLAEILDGLGAPGVVADIVKALSPIAEGIAALFRGDPETAILNIAAGIGDLAEAIFGVDAAKAGEIALFVKTLGEWALKAAGNVAAFIGNLASKAYQAALAWWGENGPAVITKVREFGAAALDAAGKFAQFALDLGATGWQNTLEWFKTDGPTVAGNMTTIADSIRGIIGALGAAGGDADRMGDTVKILGDFQNLQLGKVSADIQMLADSMQAVSAVVTPAIDWLTNLFGGLSGLSQAPDIANIAAKLNELIAPAAMISRLFNEFTAALTTLKDNIANAGGIGQFLDTLGQEITDLWNSPGVQDVIGLFKTIFSVWSADKADAERPANELATTITKTFAGLASDLVGHSIVPDMVDDIIDLFGGMPERGKKAILAGLGKLKEAGRQLVEGLRAGIEDSWGGFVNWLTGQVSGLVQSILAALGISSPPRWAIDAGAWIPKALAMGIASEMGTLDRAVAKVGAIASTGAISAPRLMPAGFPGGVAYGGGHYGGRGQSGPSGPIEIRAGDTNYVTINDRMAASMWMDRARAKTSDRINRGMGR